MISVFVVLQSTAIYQGKQKLKAVCQANERSISSEEIIKFAHRISASNAVAAPVTWGPGVCVCVCVCVICMCFCFYTCVCVTLCMCIRVCVIVVCVFLCVGISVCVYECDSVYLFM